jgi:hypothetical protein
MIPIEVFIPSDVVKSINALSIGPQMQVLLGLIIDWVVPLIVVVLLLQIRRGTLQ